MVTATTTSANSISDISGYCVFGEVRYGNNATGGDAEAEVGAYGQSPSVAHRAWDANTADGVNSGDVEVAFTAQAGGGSNGVVWSVDGASVFPLQYSGATYGTIAQVRIRAAVQNQARMRWSNVVVKFYKLGRETERHTQATAGPEVDASALTPPIVMEQILTLVPGNSNNTKVIVTGRVLISAPQGVTLSSDDVFGQIFVDTATCTT